MTPQGAAIRLREWYQAFKNFGKGNERTVHEFLEAAYLIESLAAELEDMTARYKIADDCAKKKGEMNEKLYAELATVKAERDALLKYITDSTWAACDICKHGIDGASAMDCKHIREVGVPCFEWRGVQREE